MAYKIPDVESFYAGTYGTAPETYGDVFTGYRLSFNRIGAPTSPQTANQISEVTARLSEGTKIIELQPIQPEVFETVPTQMLQETKQLMKLTGAEPTLHAPMIDPAGFTREGWTEYSRQESERHIMQAVERAHQLDIKGNIPVTLHASGGVPSYEWLPEKGPNAKSMIYVVNQETGTLDAIKRETMALPSPIYKRDENGMIKYNEQGKPIIDERVKKINQGNKILYEVPAEVRLDEINRKQWLDPLSRVEYEKSIIGQRVDVYSREASKLHLQRQAGIKLTEEQERALDSYTGELKTVSNLMGDFDYNLRELYHRAYYFGVTKNANINDEERKKYQEILDKATKTYNESIQKIEQLRKRENGTYANYDELVNEDPYKFSQIIDERSKAEQKLIDSLRKIQPKTWVPAEDFALEKSKETISNVALKAFQQFGDKAPIICMENFFPNTVFSRAESLKKLAEESRVEFVRKAKEKGISEDEAKLIAKKIIGVTWDTGHINMMRKYGYGEDEEGQFSKKKFGKFMAEETKKIAPFVKHVHVTDNFGYNDTHLPPGMGEVPFKEILKELEKAGYSGKNIVEAGGFVAHKMGMPTPYVLEAFGSPVYGMDAQPYWNQMRMTGLPQGYFSGYGMMLPEQHFSTYGSGFATLPQELGGQMPGRGQRFSGAPME